MAKEKNAKSLANLKQGGTTNLLQGRPVRPRKPKRLSPEQELFCVKRALLKGVRTAAAEAGVSETAGWTWNRDPLVQARVEELKPIIAAEIREKIIEKFVLDVEHLDVEVTRVASMQKPHKYRGFSDKVHAIELGYRRHPGALQPKTSVSATANAGAMAIAGTTAKEVYKSKWILQNEEKMRLQLESENTPPSQ